MPDRPHLAWPIQWGPHGYLTVEQDSDDDVAAVIGCICSWPQGTHPSLPVFGILDPDFLQGGADIGEIKAAIMENEPRAADLDVLQDDAQLANYLASVGVSFTVRVDA